MWKSLVVVVAACTPAAPTEPALVIGANDVGRWFESEPFAVTVEWHGANDCVSSNPGCEPGPAFSITSATCSGCTVSDVPTGTIEDGAKLTVLATSTDVIDLAVTVASGEAVRVLTASAIGDREAGLRVDCKVIATENLQTSELYAADFVPCGATHTADEAVILAPSITTAHGMSRFPFCADDDATCARRTSQIAFTGAEIAWEDIRDFVTLTDATIAHQIAVTAPLADGTLSTATVMTPPQSAN
jgi:hypothetical protein